MSETEDTNPVLMIPPPQSREQITIDAIKLVLEARDEIRGYRRELFDPGGALDRFTSKLGDLERTLKTHDEHESANHKLLRESIRNTQSQVDGLAIRMTTAERRLDDHADLFEELERRSGPATEPAPPG